MSVVIRTKIHNLYKFVCLNKEELQEIDVFLSKGKYTIEVWSLAFFSSNILTSPFDHCIFAYFKILQMN